MLRVYEGTFLAFMHEQYKGPSVLFGTLTPIQDTILALWWWLCSRLRSIYRNTPIRIKEHSEEELAGGGFTCSISSSLK